MRFQAVISGLGEHIHIPIEAEDESQAMALASAEAQGLPRLLRKQIKVRPLKEGEQAKDDRAELKFVDEPRMGRPSQGRSYRLQATITPAQAAWLEAQKGASGASSVSDVVYRLIDEAMNDK